MFILWSMFHLLFWSVHTKNCRQTFTFSSGRCKNRSSVVETEYQIERERALKATQQNKPLIYTTNTNVDDFVPQLNVNANVEADLMQTYPGESPDGYMKTGYGEHVPLQDERENKSDNNDIETEAQDRGDVRWPMVFERETSIPHALLNEVHKRERMQIDTWIRVCLRKVHRTYTILFLILLNCRTVYSSRYCLW